MKTDDLAAALDVVADVMIPASGDWPAPSAMSMAADLLTRVRGDERAQLESAIALLDDESGFADAAADIRVARLTALSEREPAVFEVLRRCIYYAYYAQPAVVRTLQDKGYDINEAPQPRGYHMDQITPDDLARIDRKRIVWIPADQVGASLRTAS